MKIGVYCKIISKNKEKNYEKKRKITKKYFSLLSAFLLFMMVGLQAQTTEIKKLAKFAGNSTRFVDANDSVWVWGENVAVALGDGTSTNSSLPVNITESGAFSGNTIVTLGGADIFGLALDNNYQLIYNYDISIVTRQQ